MTRPAASAPPPALSPSNGPARGPALSLSNGLGLTGLAGLVVITLASPGSTRMFAWPWSLAYAGALLAPALALVFRAFDLRRPLALPSPAWRTATLAGAAVVLASALASPHRGPSLQWSAPLLALGVIGEYLGRMYESVKSRPIYVIEGIYQTGGDQPGLARTLPAGNEPSLPPAPRA
ncbi:MAG: hypothetical protein EXS32_02555 [Opitutus sp.]|nr:hypothetical protein [Opitutus sp.]